MHLLRFSIKQLDYYWRVHLRKFVTFKCLKQDNSGQNFICNNIFYIMIPGQKFIQKV